jgi:hypothetical protein
MLGYDNKNVHLMREDESILQMTLVAKKYVAG